MLSFSGHRNSADREIECGGRRKMETHVTGHPAMWKSAKDQQWHALTEEKIFGVWAVTALSGNGWSRLR